MKYTGILTTLSVMATFTAFSSASMAAIHYKLTDCAPGCAKVIARQPIGCLNGQGQVAESDGSNIYVTTNCKIQDVTTILQKIEACNDCRATIQVK